MRNLFYKQQLNTLAQLNKNFILVVLANILALSVSSQIAFQFIEIPAGKYILGQRGHVNNPLHTVDLKKPYYISNLEITNAQFKEFIDETHYITDAEKSHNALVFVPGLGVYEWLEDSTAQWRFPNGISRGGIESKMDHPVTCISYRDVLAYCKWANVRLPSLDEWEIACRAGSSTKLFFGNDKTQISKYANIWNGKNHFSQDTTDLYTYTSPVGHFQPNLWGLYDMYGNVFEFCEGSIASARNIANVACARGGSWWCSKNTCNFFNSVDIGRVKKNASFSNQGFRVVRDKN